MSPADAVPQLLDALLDLRHVIADLDSIRRELEQPNPTVNRVLLKTRDAAGDLATALGVPLTTTPTE